MTQNWENERTRIKIIGVGGAGTNAVDRLKLENLDQVNLAVINTDGQSINMSPISEKILLGRGVTRGLSTGGEVEMGRLAAESDKEILKKTIEGCDLIFILAGLGGGTGSGAAPVLAELAMESDALVVAFVTMPFSREGSRRCKQAEDALALMRRHCHAVISLPNDILLQQIDENATLMEAFAIADEWINQGVRSIWALIFQTGMINVDFATLKRAFSERGGKTLYGTGYAKGEDYVSKALHDLEICPLLHLPENKYIRRTDNLIVNIVGGPDLTMSKVNEVMEYVTDKFGSRDNLVLGAIIDGSMSQSLRITVIGMTGLGSGKAFASVPAASSIANSHTMPSALKSSTSPIVDHSHRLNESRAERKRLKSLQEEFTFNQEQETRGFFQKTAENLFDGEDLDIPTYYRRGIKIQLEAPATCRVVESSR